MIKIFSANQIKDLDKYTIEHEPIASIDLMERASKKFTEWFTERFNALKKVGVLCGTGNNGGDGLAIARLLREWGYPVKVWVVQGSAAASEDFTINLGRLADTGVDIARVEGFSTEILANRDIVIDALFGYGLSRPVEGIYAQVIEHVNSLDAIVVAVDMPSGLMADKPSDGAIVNADYTITFQFPKLSFFFPQYHRYTGEWKVVDIGLDKEYQRKLDTSYYYLTQKSIRALIQKRKRFDHKGSFGHALLVSGSYGKMGAAVLSSRAVLRSGVGLLTVYAPFCGYEILQTSVPEAMVNTDPDEKAIGTAPDSDGFSAIGVGPGIGQSKDTVTMLRSLLEKTGKPVVIDADALNILGSNREMFHLIPKGSILTPHPKEFERLIGKWSNDFERLNKQVRLARELQSVIVLKGAYTAIASPGGKVYFNSNGNPGMATGGTGDVLTGILTGLLAQGYPAETAAIMGVYLHGSAGDLAQMELGEESLIASDLVEFLPAAFRMLKR